MQLTARTHSGFTLVELLLVVAIIAVLSAFLIPGFSNYIDNQNLIQSQEILKSDLRTAQNKALTGVGSSIGVNYWGIKIPSAAAENYIFFSSSEASGATCDTISSGETTPILPNGAVVTGSNGACVFFSARNGDALIFNNNGSELLQVAYPGDTPCFGVQINSVGMMRGIDSCN